MNRSVLPSTVGAIANRFEATLHQVRYVVESRGIVPLAKIGCANVYAESDVLRIGTELALIAQARGETKAVRDDR
ncbi:MAG: hypothetical protein ABIP55_17000 [Tepidisphaeraceae bacterium]